MANEKMPTWPQVVLQPAKHPLLSVLFKINHHIAQEYDVKLADVGNFANKIDMLKLNPLADSRIYQQKTVVFIHPFKAIFSKQAWRNVFRS